MLKQAIAVISMNFKSLSQRFWPSLVIVIGMACVVGVLVSMMSFTVGAMTSFAADGNPGNVMVMSQGVQNESQSSLPRNDFAIIADAPGIARDASGKPIADSEILNPIPMTLKEKGLDSTMIMRGIGPQGVALRPHFKLVAGRMFRPGAREMIVGRAAQGQFENTALGDKIILPDGEWPIVGVFTSGGDTFEGGFIADTETAMTAMHKTAYNSVLLKLSDRAAFEPLRRALTTNPALTATVERETAYYERNSRLFGIFFTAIAYILSGIMAVGAVFGALNTMYAAVSARTREIATLRALGFGTVPVVLSILSEALLLALIGALIGAAIAWALFDGNQKHMGANVFHLMVTPGLVMLGIVWALIVGFIGGLFPSIRAVRMPVATAIRAT